MAPRLRNQNGLQRRVVGVTPGGVVGRSRPTCLRHAGLAWLGDTGRVLQWAVCVTVADGTFGGPQWASGVGASLWLDDSWCDRALTGVWFWSWRLAGTWWERAVPSGETWRALCTCIVGIPGIKTNSHYCVVYLIPDELITAVIYLEFIVCLFFSTLLFTWTYSFFTWDLLLRTRVCVLLWPLCIWMLCKLNIVGELCVSSLVLLFVYVRNTLRFHDFLWFTPRFTLVHGTWYIEWRMWWLTLVIRVNTDAYDVHTGLVSN